VPGETFSTFSLCGSELFEAFDSHGRERLVERVEINCEAVVFDSHLTCFADPTADDNRVFLQDRISFALYRLCHSGPVRRHRRLKLRLKPF